MGQRNCHLRHSQQYAHIPTMRQIYQILNPCDNPDVHVAGSLPCCEGIVIDPISQVFEIQRLLDRLKNE